MQKYQIRHSNMLQLIFIISIFLLTSLSCNLLTAIQASESNSALIDFLNHIPDTEEHRSWITYGDAETWYSAWGISRPASVDSIKDLDPKTEKPYILYVLPRQTMPPVSLRTEYMLSEDQRALFGFDLLKIDRYLESGQPPNTVTLVEFSFDQQQIADALVKSGYQAQEMEAGVLYSIRGDNEIDIDSPIRTNQFGNLNRIYLMENTMIIGAATDVVQNAIAANNGQIPSLADNQDYVAVVQALESKASQKLGDLVGVILLDDTALKDLNAVALNSEQGRGSLEAYAQNPLDSFNLAAFVTFQEQHTTYFALYLIFPSGIDAQSASDLVAERLQNYKSIYLQATLDDRWTFEQATSFEVNDSPVALVVMRAVANEPKEITEGSYAVPLWSWHQMVISRDLLFLVTE